MASDDPASLERLHDIVLPVPVSAWPPAPGWWLLALLLLALLLWIARRAWRRWRADAYRREALRLLETAQDVGAIDSVLRRCALAIAPRRTVAEARGDAWVDWLGARTGRPVPAELRAALRDGPYRRDAGASIDALRAFARDWVREHRATAPGTV